MKATYVRNTVLAFVVIILLTATAGFGCGGDVVNEVSGVASDVTGQRTIITWTTSTVATSQVEYGATTDYGSTTELDADMVSNHSVIVSGLPGGTTYHYRVKSRDESGVEIASDDSTFTTPPQSFGVSNVMAHEPMPIVLLSGTEYEMGYQYGQQLGVYLEAVKKQCWDHIGDTMERDAVIETITELASLTEENLPDVDFLDRFRGTAQGAQDAGYDITYEDALLCAFRSQVVMLVEDNLCSVVAVWGEGTADGKTIVGVNYDFGRSPFNYYEVAVVAYPDDANAYISHGIAGKLGDNFIMNDKGLVIGMNSGQSSSAINVGYEVTAWCLFPYVAMVSSTAQEARDVVLDKFTGWDINWNISDADGNAYAVETARTITSQREPGDFGEENYLITTNCYLNPEMEQERGMRVPPTAVAGILLWNRVLKTITAK